MASSSSARTFCEKRGRKESLVPRWRMRREAAIWSPSTPISVLPCLGLRAMRQLPVGTREVAGIAVGVALEVILVLGLRFPEGTNRRHFGHDLARPQAGGIDVGDRVLRNTLLFIVHVEDRGTIACPDVIALAVARCRIMDLEEELEQRAIARDPRIENDLDRLGVGAMVAIGGVRHIAARIADARGDHSRLLPDQILHAPEAAAGENRSFCLRHHFTSPFS